MYFLEVAGNAMLIVAALVLLVFVVTYHVRAEWSASVGGRHVMLFSIAVLMILGTRIVATFTGVDHWGIDLARAIVYGVLVLAVSHRMWLLTDDLRGPSLEDGDDDGGEDERAEAGRA